MSRRLFAWSFAFSVLPFIYGLALYPFLPETLPIHWGISGEPDAFSSALVALFIPPLIFVWLHVFVYLTLNSVFLSGKKLSLTWLALMGIAPFMSNLLVIQMLLYAFKPQTDVSFLVLVYVGLVFMGIGIDMTRNVFNQAETLSYPWSAMPPNIRAKVFAKGGIWLSIVGMLQVLFAFVNVTLALVGLSLPILCLVAMMVYGHRLGNS